MLRKSESEMFSIPIGLIERVKSEVVNKLNVTDIFKLNDKLDGLFYLNKQMKRILSLYVVEKSFKIKILNDDKLLKSQSTILFDERRIHVLGVDYGEKIKIPNVKTDDYLVVGFFNGNKKGKILGTLSVDECLKLDEPGESKNSVISKQIIAVVSKENLKEYNDDKSFEK